MWLGMREQQEWKRTDGEITADWLMEQSSRQREKEQLAGKAASGSSRQWSWQGMAGGECCEHQGQKHCSTEEYPCSK